MSCEVSRVVQRQGRGSPGNDKEVEHCPKRSGSGVYRHGKGALLIWDIVVAYPEKC